jgi:C-terminal processing protease CtpA/Prc
LFLEKGSVVAIFRSENYDDNILLSTGTYQINASEITVIVDNETASAAEVFALALRENLENVTIMGENTFGKGFGTSERVMENESRYCLVSFVWVSPHGHNITGTGIQPDIEMDPRLEIEEILLILS